MVFLYVKRKCAVRFSSIIFLVAIACCDDVNTCIHTSNKYMQVHIKSSYGVAQAENQFRLLDTIDRR